MAECSSAEKLVVVRLSAGVQQRFSKKMSVDSAECERLVALLETIDKRNAMPPAAVCVYSFGSFGALHTVTVGKITAIISVIGARVVVENFCEHHEIQDVQRELILRLEPLFAQT